MPASAKGMRATSAPAIDSPGAARRGTLAGSARFAALMAFLLGAFGVLAHAPFGWAPLSWLALGGLYLLLTRSASVRQAMAVGFSFGAGMFLLGVSWVYVSMSTFGGMAAPLAAAATVLFCLVLALYPLLAAALFQRLRTANDWANVALFAAAWGLCELLRGWVLSGFPWLALGYAQVPGSGSTLSGFAPLVGVFGVSVIAATLGALGAEAWRQTTWTASRRRIAVRPLALASALVGFGYVATLVSWTEPVGAPVRVALLQGNVEQDLKWSPENYMASLRIYHDLIREHPAALTVLPETAFPSYLSQLPTGYVDALLKLAARENGAILAGLVVGDRARYTNSLVRLGGAPTEIYSKTHLVPFGEFVPPGFDWFMRQMKIPMSGFTPGPAMQPPLAMAGQKVAVNICYEDLFGEEIIRALPAATLLVNVSNTAWFGRSWAQPQHLQIAQMRARETGRPMLRATNTGMTAIIGVDGRVTRQLEPFTRGALVATVNGYQGQTPFARFGNATALLLVLVMALPALVLRRPWRRENR